MLDAEQLRIAHHLVTKGLIQHNGIPPMEAGDYLNGSLPPNVKEKLMRGGIIPESQGNLDIYSLQRKDIMPVLLPHLQYYYNLAQYSLYLGHDGKFNEHRCKHVANVGKDAGNLLEVLGYDEVLQADAEIAGAFHDIGITNSRPFHHLTSAVWMEHAFPDLQQDTQRYERIRGAVIMHNEGYYKVPQFQGRGFEEKLGIIRQQHTPVSSAVLIADKADVVRQRVPNHARNREELFNYPHYAGNWYMRRDYVGPTPTQQQFRMNFTFFPYLTPGEAMKYQSLAGEPVTGTENLYHSLAPPDLRLDPQDEFSPASIVAVWGQFWSLYGPKNPGDVNRIELAALNAWHLCPDAEEFIVSLRNPIHPGEAIEQRFTKDTADEIFAYYAEQYGGHAH